MWWYIQDILELLYTKRTTLLTVSPWIICKLSNSREHMSGNDTNDILLIGESLICHKSSTSLKHSVDIRGHWLFLFKEKGTLTLATVFPVPCLKPMLSKINLEIYKENYHHDHNCVRPEGWFITLLIQVRELSSFRQPKSRFFYVCVLMCWI